MVSLANLTFSGKSSCQVNFSGGDLSSTAGLLLYDKFLYDIGFREYIQQKFGSPKPKYQHSGADCLLQKLLQITAGYQTDALSDYLSDDPVFKQILGKMRLASQPTMSRYFQKLDKENLQMLEDTLRWSRQRAYQIKMPKQVIFDIDTTMLHTEGKQEGSAYIHHYADTGYHPILCFDGKTGDLLKAELRKGNTYCGTDADTFVRPLLEEYRENFPSVEVLLRGDSGFAMPKLYECAESFAKVSYVIRLKLNRILEKHVANQTDAMMEERKDFPNKRLVSYGEFSYRAKKWDKPRRVVCKIEFQPEDESPRYAFFVTNLKKTPKKIIRIYCKRGNMENFIKEFKNGFVPHLSSRTMINNANRFALAALAYNLCNLFRRLCLSGLWQMMRINELRLTLFQIACRRVKHAGMVVMKFCSSYPFKREFYAIYQQICNVAS